MKHRRQSFAAMWIVFSAFGASSASAQTPQAAALSNLLTPSNVVTLSASASVEVARDVLNLVFSTTREGSDAAIVQSQLKQALEAALSEARKAARPGQVDVSTGNFSLYLRQPPKGGISLWQGSAELNVDGRDIEAISKLAGRVQTMTVARVGYSLSREARQAVEGDVAAQAIAAFRARADAYAKNFGFGGVVYREIQVSVDEPQVRPMSMMRSAQAMDSMKQQAPTEKAYRKDAGAHFYSAYPAHVYYGKLPPLLYAIAVTETEVDAQGAVLNVRIKRAPAGAKHVGPWVVDLIRGAAPLPPPVRMGKVRFIEIWLIDRSGRFQVDSLTEGQL